MKMLSPRELVCNLVELELTEAQWMYHGSSHKDISSLKPDRSEYMLDRAIGSHFAADKAVSQRFVGGHHPLYGGEKPKAQGVVYKAKAPPRSQLYVVPQGKHSDQHAIGSHVSSTVFSQPEHKQMFKDWIKRARAVDDETAEKVHTHLSKGEAPNKKEYGTASSSNTSFRSYMGNFDSGLMSEPRKGFRQEVVHKYLDIMHKRGIKGLVYQNTSPMETHDQEGSGKVRSKKSYVIFHPHELELQHDQ